jgi:NADPH:quinone reductase-like Zn-dependent oxidoreductase
MPSMMRAVQFDRFGGSEVLEVRTVSVPSPGHGEVLVRVHASGLNVKDAVVRASASLLHGRAHFPRGTGFDFAGEVAALGEGVTDLEVGQAVWGFLDGAKGGAAAEYVVARRDWLAPKPASLDWITAAAMPLVATTALQALRDRGRLQAGEHVLIKGASGGVGTATIQVAKAFGAHVTALASRDSLALARSLGADVAVDHRRTHPRELGRRFDVFIDAVGESSLSTYGKVLAPHGRWVTVAPDLRIYILAPFTWILPSFVHVPRLDFVAVRPKRADLEEVGRLVDRGLLRMPVMATYPLDEIRAAHDAVATRHGRGKRVVVVSSA